MLIKKRDITIIDRKHYKNEKDNNIYKMYKYRCNKCGFECGEHYKKGEYQEEYWILESGLLRGTGCACCSSSSKIVVQGINDIPTTAPELVKYFQGGIDEAKKYTKSSNQKIYPICPDCRRVRGKTISINRICQSHLIGCSCGDGISYPTKIMYNILEQLNIKFITEYNPKWIKPRRYDFYFEINNKNHIIEMDGALGHGNGVHGNDTKTIEETIEIDKYKDKMANEHDIEVIRIDCNESKLEYIKNNTLIKLNELFDLSSIDWIKVEEFALSNLVKKVCEIKRDNPNMTTGEIGTIMNLNYQTIKKYLKKGSKIWDWIDYDPKKESLKSSSKAGKMNGKTVEIFKDRESLGVFESCAELERQSEEKFGVKLNSSTISNICLGKRKHYQGFTFKYV